jgi:hypothetical protein
MISFFKSLGVIYGGKCVNIIQDKILQRNKKHDKKYIYLGICGIIGLNIPQSPPSPSSQLSQLTYIKDKINIFNDKKYAYAYDDNDDDEKLECSSGFIIYNRFDNTYDRCYYSFTVSILNNDIVNQTLKKFIPLISADKINERMLKQYIEDIVDDCVKSYMKYDYDKIDRNYKIDKEKIVNRVNDKLCKLNYQITLNNFDIKKT